MSSTFCAQSFGMTEKNSIVLAVNDLDFGGAQRTVVEEVRELVRRNIPVVVVTTLANPKLGLAHLLAGVRIERLEFRSLFDVRAHMRLVRLFRTLHPRAVVSNLFFTNTVVRIAKMCVPSVRVVVREGNVLTEKSVFVMIVDALLSAVTALVLVNAHFLRAPIGRVNPFTKVKVLYNGIGEVFFSPSHKREEMRRNLGIATDAFVVITVGSLTEKKGQQYLIDACKRVPNAHLLVVGDGYLRFELEKHASDHIRFLGARSDIRDLYAASDVFVLPSLWEGMPNAMLEALASGLPVVATDVGGVSEIVENDKNGFLVPARDSDALRGATETLKNGLEMRARMSGNASLSVKNMTWRNHTDALLEVL